MCEYCGHSGWHSSGCPNAPDPEAVYECKWCKESICEGDEYYELEGDYYHEECFGDAAVSILTNDYGAVSGTAEATDYEAEYADFEYDSAREEALLEKYN